MRVFAIMIAFLGFSVFALAESDAYASETTFLNSIDGNWLGTGTVKVNTSVPPVNVKCGFNSVTIAGRFDLTGNCRALLVVQKLIAAKLTVSNDQYWGTYTGARSGTARLSGSRSGNSISLKIGWAGTVNGDRMARMLIRKNSADNLELIISDLNPKTGIRQITSHFNLVRK